MANTHKHYAFLFLLMFVILSVNMVSAVKPITDIQVSEGYSVQPTEKSAIIYGQDHEFEVHVFNISNGMPITSGITCYMHLYHETGKHIYEGVDDTAGHIFDYSFNLNGTNFTSLGEYQAKFQCNSSSLGGGTEFFFIVNNYGEELSTAHSIKFNSAMFFMMILFIMAMMGIFGIENVIGKFACYWIAHILFVVGTFSMWQFNFGYATKFVGLAGTWKVLFYVGIFSMLPMMILSIAGLISYWAMDKNVQKLIDKGMPEGEAYRRQGRKFK